ncbi:MAG: DUF853 domain-containing protein [Coriobacteriia bacterium]|nr:DUF853 domain-containing protein [Coriobacteriia bacterium]MCL2750251.1 DUF853 domain-containing protein [Coriobacteriia bacterium]
MYLKDENKIWIASGNDGADPIYLLPEMMNRHGLITGATGTGKTTTMKAIAEALSEMGTPTFLADIKGDVSGMCKPGKLKGKITDRIEYLKIQDYTPTAYPVTFFDFFGQKGIPVRLAVSTLGPILLARILGLNDTQTGVLQIVFKIADDSNLLMLDFKDLRSMLQYAGDNAKAFTTQYGNITTASVGAIQRRLLTLESAGAESFFGEPELDLQDWFTTDDQGRGAVNILDCVSLSQDPLLYSTFLLWMLSELFETLPEVGNPKKPKMVFFFDEAHLLFKDAPKALLQKIEQIVRLIRSKGVGIFFITQNPSDIPNAVLSQLGNKIQHALRPFTPNDQKAIKAVAASLRSNPDFNSETAISELANGEALISALDEVGSPQMVKRGFIYPLRCGGGVADPELVESITKSSPLYAKYAEPFDRYSAYEALEENKQREAQQREQEALEAQQQKELQQQEKEAAKPKPKPSGGRSSSRATPLEKALTSTLSQFGRTASRELARGLFGTRKK